MRPFESHHFEVATDPNSPWSKLFQEQMGHHALLLLLDAENAHPLNLEWISQLAHFQCGGGSQPWDARSQIGHPDVFIVHRTRPTLRREDVEELSWHAQNPPFYWKRRFCFLENMERLLPASANALLKILEEPQSEVLFLGTTTRPQEILPTILSRFQKVSLPKVTPNPDLVNASQSNNEAMPQGDLPQSWEALLSEMKNRIPSTGTSWPEALKVECVARAIPILESLGKSTKGQNLIDIHQKIFFRVFGRHHPLAPALITQQMKEWSHALPYHPNPVGRAIRLLLSLISLQ